MFNAFLIIGIKNLQHKCYYLNHFKKIFTYFCLLWVFVAMQGLSLVAIHGLLFAAASLVAEHGLLGTWDSVAVAHGLSCCAACGIFPDQESDQCPLHCCRADS